MELWSIGDFARACGLSHKALRLYADSGLLAPAYVDPGSGYRFYDPAQLATARLVAELRGLGMPLAQVADVVRLAPGDAADAVAAYWAQVEERTGARRDRAAFLVDRLARKDPAMTTTTYRFRAAAACDPGLVRPEQQDAAHADEAVVAVADGFGPEGAAAARVAVEALVAAAAAEEDGLAAADAAVVAAGGAGWETTSGTTLTGLAGGRLVHVGDSRAYVLRDGGLLLVSRDDAMVQDLVDAGRLTPAEARAHPQRAVLTRALPGHVAGAAARPVDVRPGDRWLLCTDGLSAVLDDAVVRVALASAADPDAAASALVDAVRAAGAPDNVAVVVADVVAAD